MPAPPLPEMTLRVGVIRAADDLAASVGNNADAANHVGYAEIEPLASVPM